MDAEDEHRYYYYSITCYGIMYYYGSAGDVSNIVSAIVKAYTCLPQGACAAVYSKEATNPMCPNRRKCVDKSTVYSLRRFMHNIKQRNKLHILAAARQDYDVGGNEKHCSRSIGLLRSEHWAWQ